MLQSMGGGGGAVFTSAAAANVTLSADNSGSGGNIAFTQNGSIGTLGDNSYALFAQSVGGGGGFVDGSFAGSAGGAGGAGTITLDLNGDVLALGAGSTGLFAQSIAANGLGGDITARWRRTSSWSAASMAWPCTSTAAPRTASPTTAR